MHQINKKYCYRIDVGMCMSQIYKYICHDEIQLSDICDYCIMCYAIRNYNKIQEISDELNTANSHYILGSLCYDRKEYVTAKEHYIIAVNKNNSDAMSNLGYYYEYVENDVYMAKKYYKMSADLGNPIGSYNLGYLCCHVEKDYATGLKYYNDSANNNDTDAIFALAHYYEVVDYNKTLSLKYYMKGCELNDISCIDGAIKMSSLIEVYVATNNKNGVFDFCLSHEINIGPIVKYDKLISNAQIDICQNCYNETKCIDDDCICVDCYLDLSKN